MATSTTFPQWLEEKIRAYGNAHNLATALGIDDSKMTRWRRYGIIPQPGEMLRLALATNTPLHVIVEMLDQATRERRAMMPRGGPRVPPPTRAPVRRVKKALGAVALAAGILAYQETGATSTPLPVVVAETPTPSYRTRTRRAA
jgi:hypothetical protein